MSAFTAVLFDFYGTLAVARSAGNRIGDLVARRGIAVPSDFATRWEATWDAHLDHSAHSETRDAYRAFRRAQRRELLLEFGVGADDVDAVLDDVDSDSLNLEMRAYPETVEVLEKLRAAGITVVICSNWDWDLDRAVASAGLSDLVDVEITSARVGFRKPHRGIYGRALEIVGVAAGEVVFVGDTWDCDVLGPIEAGMTAVHVHRGDRDTPAPDLPPGAFRVVDLRGVLDLV